jgi:hypothetical protein
MEFEDNEVFRNLSDDEEDEIFRGVDKIDTEVEMIESPDKISTLYMEEFRVESKKRKLISISIPKVVVNLEEDSAPSSNEITQNPVKFSNNIELKLPKMNKASWNEKRAKNSQIFQPKISAPKHKVEFISI